jgi:hypothetical protein
MVGRPGCLLASSYVSFAKMQLDQLEKLLVEPL